MKKLIFFLAAALLARENPFVLPAKNAPAKTGPQAQSAPAVEANATKVDVFAKKEASQPQKEPKPRLVADLRYLRIFQKGGEVRLETKERLRRAFVLDTEPKAVFDFRSRRAPATRRFELEPPFKQAVIGAHRGYYRVVIEGDGCRPKVDKVRLRAYCPGATAP